MHSPYSSPALLLIASSLLALSACDDKKKPTPADDPAQTSATTSATDPNAASETTAKADATPTEKKAKKTRPANAKVASKNKEEAQKLYESYRKHLREGRKLVQKKKYKEGLEEFSRAQKIDPNNARILSEIGWASFLAKDYERAIQANNDSVRFARSNKIKGASLYNLGRVAQAQGDENLAVTYYERSLIARPHDAVKARLDALIASGAKSERAKKDLYEYFDGCGFAPLGGGQDLEEACRAMALSLDPSPVCHAGGGEGGANLIEVKGGDKLTRAATFKVHVEDDWTEYYMLALQYDGAWHGTPIVWVYNPGAFGIYEDLSEGPEIEVKQLVPGGEPELVVTFTHSRHDTDMGLDEEEDETRSQLIVVGIHEGKPTTMLSEMTHYSYVRDNIGLDGEQVPTDLSTPGLPIKKEHALAVTFDEKGSATIAAVSGKAMSPDIKKGKRSLLDNACATKGAK